MTLANRHPTLHTSDSVGSKLAFLAVIHFFITWQFSEPPDRSSTFALMAGSLWTIAAVADGAVLPLLTGGEGSGGVGGGTPSTSGS